MNLEDVVDHVALRNKLDVTKKQAVEVARIIFSAIPEMAVNAPVRTPIGTFKLVIMPERKVKNNLTNGETVTIPSRHVLKFKEKKGGDRIG